MGRFCKHGKETERYPSSGKCKNCSRERAKGHYQRNRDHARSRGRVWTSQNKEHLYRYYLRRTYGITPEQYDAMFAAQDGRCSICRTDDPGSKFQRWHVDHCHNTGIVRGILCAQCNVMIGMAREDVNILAAGIRYLEELPDAAH